MIWTLGLARDATARNSSTGRSSMLRREFGKVALGVMASTALRNPAEAGAQVAAGSDFPRRHEATL